MTHHAAAGNLRHNINNTDDRKQSQCCTKFLGIILGLPSSLCGFMATACQSEVPGCNSSWAKVLYMEADFLHKLMQLAAFWHNLLLCKLHIMTSESNGGNNYDLKITFPIISFLVFYQQIDRHILTNILYNILFLLVVLFRDILI